MSRSSHIILLNDTIAISGMWEYIIGIYSGPYSSPWHLWDSSHPTSDCYWAFSLIVSFTIMLLLQVAVSVVRASLQVVPFYVYTYIYSTTYLYISRYMYIYIYIYVHVLTHLCMTTYHTYSGLVMWGFSHVQA